MSKTISKLSAVTLAGVLAASTFSLYTFQAAAFMGGDDDRTVVRTSNNGTVTNNVSVNANSGGNHADGGGSGHGGDGGNATRGTAGRGGNGGNGGDAGSVTSGNATAIGTVQNDVNRNNVTFEGCGCDDDDEMDRFSRFFHFSGDSTLMRVDTSNTARVGTTLDVDANTGRNTVDGGKGAGAGAGGDALGSRSWLAWFWMNQGGNGGNGGNGGSGGTGSTIRTGAAGADGMVTNIVNRNVVRVGNGDDEDEVEVDA